MLEKYAIESFGFCILLSSSTLCRVEGQIPQLEKIKCFFSYTVPMYRKIYKIYNNYTLNSLTFTSVFKTEIKKIKLLKLKIQKTEYTR